MSDVLKLTLGAAAGAIREKKASSLELTQAALALPSGFTPNGLPCGLQLIGRPFAESLLYRIGAAYQGATDWHTRMPAAAA